VPLLEIRRSKDALPDWSVVAGPLLVKLARDGQSFFRISTGHEDFCGTDAVAGHLSEDVPRYVVAAILKQAGLKK